MHEACGAAALRPAVAADLPAILAVLTEAGLPTLGVAAMVGEMVVAERHREVVGAVGLEPAGPDRLLRSLATAVEERGRGTGQALVARALAEARRAGVRHLWLLTEGAAPLFERFGFRLVPRGDAPPSLQALAEFAHACPAAATAMVRRAQPLRVLVLCTANSARSQIAEALLMHRGGDLIRAASAGSHPGAGVHPMAVAALAERGIAWEGRRSKGIDAVQGQPWDLVLTVCDAARDACPVLPGAASVHWGMPDPAQADPAGAGEAFRETVDALEARVRRLLALPLALLEGAALRAAVAAIHTEE